MSSVINNYFTVENFEYFIKLKDSYDLMYVAVLSSAFFAFGFYSFSALCYCSRKQRPDLGKDTKSFFIGAVIATVLCIINVGARAEIVKSDMYKALVAYELEDSEILDYDNNEHALLVSKNGDTETVSLENVNVEVSGEYGQIVFDCETGTAYIPNRYIPNGFIVYDEYDSDAVDDYYEHSKAENIMYKVFIAMFIITVIANIIASRLINKKDKSTVKKNNSNEVTQTVVLVDAVIALMMLLCFYAVACSDKNKAWVQAEVGTGTIIGYKEYTEYSGRVKSDKMNFTVLNEDNTIKLIKMGRKYKIVERNDIDCNYIDYPNGTIYTPYE